MADTPRLALIELARATVHPLDAPTLALYLERLQCFDGPVIIAACRNLELSARWFPKLAEVVDACRLINAQHRTPPRREPEDFVPVTDAEAKQWLDRIKQTARIRTRG